MLGNEPEVLDFKFVDVRLLVFELIKKSSKTGSLPKEASSGTVLNSGNVDFFKIKITDNRHKLWLSQSSHLIYFNLISSSPYRAYTYVKSRGWQSKHREPSDVDMYTPSERRITYYSIFLAETK